MHTFIPITKATTLYSRFTTLNTGKDAILELENRLLTSSVEYSRFLLQFNTESIPTTVPIGASYSLQVFNVNEDISNEVDVVEAYYVTEEWDEGSSHFVENETTFKWCDLVE